MKNSFSDGLKAIFVKKSQKKASNQENNGICEPFGLFNASSSFSQILQ